MKKPFTRAFIFVILYMTQDEKKMKHVLRLEFEAFTNMENLIEQHCNNKDCNCVFFQRGIIDSMNKIFKVVWSKTKECYVVVSEVAKNNSGKKKVLASVLATLAIMGAGAQMGTPVQAGGNYGNSAVNVAPDNLAGKQYGNTVDKNSVVVGYLNTTKQESGAAADGEGHFIFGANNRASAASSLAVGNNNVATGGGSSAIGASSKATKAAALAVGNVARAEATGATAIGTHANADKDGNSLTVGEYSTAVGGWTNASGTNASAFGYKAQATADFSVAVGVETEANKNNAVAIGRMSKATNTSAVAVGVNNKAAGQDSTSVGSSNTVNGDQSSAFGRENVIDGASVAGAVAVGYKNKASGDRAIAIGEENESKEADTITMGNKNTANTGGGIAIGKGNTANSTAGGGSAGVNSQIAIGRDNQAVDEDTLAVGRENKATERLAMAIGNRTEATGVGSIAIGSNGAPDGTGLIPKTISSGTFSVALGAQTSSTGTASVAVGGKSSATATSATAVGHGATASEQASVAVGKDATVNKQKDTSNYEFSGSNGTPSPAGYNTETITVNRAATPAGGAVAGNYYDAGSGVAIGNGATVSDESDRAVVVGPDAKTNGNAHYSVVLGSGSHADASDGFVAGHGSYVESRESISMGSGAHVSGNENIRSQAIGYGATVTGTGAYDATAIGATAQVSGVQGGVALGSGSLLSRTTNSNENVGFNSKFVDGTKVRNRAYTAKVNALGDEWDAGAQLGAVSVGNDDQKRQIINVAAGNKDTDAVNVAQLKNVGVRVGADTNTATITVGTNTSNVAADFLAYNGQLNIKGDNNRVTTVSENDTNGKDANVNVKFDYDGLVKAKAGSSVTVNQKTEDGKTVFEIDAAADKTVVTDGKNTTVSGTGTATDPYKVNVQGALTDISSITNTAGSGKITFGPDETVTVGGTNPINLNAKTGNIGGLTNKTFDPNNIVSGQAATEDQLKSAHDSLKASELHIAPTAVKSGSTEAKGGVAAGAENVYKYDAATKKVTLTYNDGNGKAVTDTKAVIDFSNLNIPAGGNNYGFKANATANGGTVANDTTTPAVATAVENGGTINYAAGKNLTVKQDIDTTNKTHTYTYSLDKDLTNLDKVVVNGKDGIAGKDGVTIVGPQGATGAPGIPGTNGIDGKVGISGKDGKDAVSIAGKDGVGTIGLTGPQGPAGTNGKSVDISTENGKQTLVKPEKNNGDQSQRIVYVPKDKDGNPLLDKDNNPIKREVATMDDGLKFAGDDGQTDANKVIAKQLNEKVDIIGGATGTLTDNNIGVNNDGGKLKVQLAKDVDLTNAGSLTVGGTKVNNDGITIKAPTTPGTTTTDVKLTNTGLDNGGNKITNVAEGTNNTDAVNVKQLKENRTEVKAGNNVVVTSAVDATDNHTVYTVNAVTPAVYTTPDGTKLTKDKDGKFHKEGETTEYTGDIITSFENPKAATGQTTKDGGMIVNNIGSAIKNQTPTMPAGQTATYLDKLKAAADAGSNVKNAAVNVSDLHNTAEALKASELHIAPTVGGKDADKGGVASGNTNPGAATQAYKYNATTKQVELTFNDGNGKAVTGPKAVIDFSDLNIPAGGNNYGFKANATANGGKVANDTTTPAAATAVENGGTVNFAAGKNLTVKQDIDATNKTQTYTFSLDKDLTNLDKIVVNGKDGIDGKDGVSITGPKGESAPGAKDGQDGKVGIAGKDGKDAVSISGKDGVGHIGLTGPQGPQGPGGTPGTPGANIDISTDHGTQTLVKPEVNNNNKSERIVYVPKDKDGNPLLDKDNNPIKREVATMDDGLRFTGNNTSKENKQEMNSLVKVQGEGVTENTTSGKLEANGQEFKSAAGNIAVVADGGTTLTVKMNKDLNLTKDGSVTMGDTVVNNDGITIKAPTTPGTTTTDVKLTNQGLDNGGNKITNVKAGTDDTDAVNVKQLKDKVTTVTSSDSSIKVVDKNVAGQPGYDATKGHQYDITINNQGVVNNAQTPVVYTKEDGTKVYLQPNGTFTTNIDGSGQVVPANEVIASMNNADKSTTTPMKLNNVGSSIADKTGTTFLDKINTAANNPNAKNGAVNVTDLKSTADAIGEKGLNFGTQSTGTNSEIHKNLGEKLEIVGGGTKADGEYDASNIKTMTKDGKVVIALDKNIKADSVTVGEKGQPGVPGKDGMDGKIGVNGKDGSAVVINGKDGSIGLNGKDGANGITIKGDKGVDGVDGLNGTNGITRIVYQDKDGNKHEVATHDDGMKFAGDDGQTDPTKVIKKHLNNVVDIVGGADKTKLTDNNIGVNNDGGKLKVQLIKDVNLTDTGSIKFGDTANNNTVINRGGITITRPAAVSTDPAITVSLTGNGLNNGGNKITNVKAGTDGTDAVNLDQLKAARTKVTSNDNSVTISRNENTTTGEITYDLHVDPNATPDLNRVNNRIDQLGEEVGRVGAQGAALSALKPIQYDPLEPTQIMAGYGNYRGNSAVALGVAHYKNESTLIHGGVSWAGGSSHMMANAGVTWKVGNRDSEAAVADRYRKGPISSTYAMQQEMAAMKAQNAGLKGEVSDLKAENEQMKAQIAAMMAKLGL